TVVGDLDDLMSLDAVGSDPALTHTLCGKGAHWLPISGFTPTLRLGRAGIQSGRVA
ncbi:MAG: hypothetical protein HOZ81_06985, partial [Streptomyces sp.]|nr:hypothetical protein [Streptomyces sp.]